MLRAPSLGFHSRPPRITRHSCGLQAPNRTMGCQLTTVLLVSFRSDWLRRDGAMKTAEKEKRNCWPALMALPRQKHLSSIMWGWKQEKLRPSEKCFLLTSPSIELSHSHDYYELHSAMGYGFKGQGHAHDRRTHKRAFPEEISPCKQIERFGICWMNQLS